MPNPKPNSPNSKWLVIDASSATLQLGIWNDGKWLSFKANQSEALEGIFHSTKVVLSEANLSLDELSGYFFCHGPGSTLGIRLAAMAIKTWQATDTHAKPCYTYNSLVLTQAHLKSVNESSSPALLIAPWKTGFFIGLETSKSTKKITAFKYEQLLSKNPSGILLLDVGRTPKKVPPEIPSFAYSIPHFSSSFNADSILSIKDDLKPFQIKTPSFEKWTPQRHRSE